MAEKAIKDLFKVLDAEGTGKVKTQDVKVVLKEVAAKEVSALNAVEEGELDRFLSSHGDEIEIDKFVEWALQNEHGNMDGLVKLLGDTLIGSGGEMPTRDALKDKAAIILYFSAHWCGPCRGFTPKLAEAYREWRASGANQEAEVVFVSWDEGDEAFKEYFAEMPWLAVPFSPSLRDLGEKFGVQGIPTLVPLGPDGNRLYASEVADARRLVTQHGSKAFPFTKANVDNLVAEQRKEQADVLQRMKEFEMDGGSGTLGDILGKDSYTMVLYSDGDYSDQTYSNAASVIKKLKDNGQRIELLYLGHCLYNADSDHDKTAEMFAGCQRCKDFDSKKDAFAKLALGDVRAPQMITLKTDADGEVTVVSTDGGCGLLREWGADGFPWSKDRVDECKAKKQARIEAIKANLAGLGVFKSEPLLGQEGKDVSADDVAAMGDDAVVGIYFSAHWCPPCRGFTPQLAALYNELKAAGKKIEVIFVSSDKDEDSFKEYFGEMPWLALPFAQRELKADLSQHFDIQGIPSLVLLKTDGTEVTRDGRAAAGYGAECFPWTAEDMARGKALAAEKAAAKKAEALKAEEAALTSQRDAGLPVLRRLRGEPGSCASHEVDAKKVVFHHFATLGAPDMVKTSGVLYYELTLESTEGIPQFGFALSGFSTQDGGSGAGVGDDKDSWGVDGSRKCTWHAGNTKPWPCAWSKGDVICLAANMDKGAVAVCKSGEWSGDSPSLIFKDDRIKEGVYPCMTAQGFTVVYNLDGDKHGNFQHAPPTDDFWDGDAFV